MGKRGSGLLVLDEFPYRAAQTPGLPSIVQALYDRIGPGSRRAPLRLVLCGSAISVMSELLSGAKALLGRGAPELKIKPFGFRDARAFWEIEDLEITIEPFQADLEAGRAELVWAEAVHTVESKIFGPHFEKLAREWVSQQRVGATGHTSIACREHRTSHEIDVISLERGARPRTAGDGDRVHRGGQGA